MSDPTCAYRAPCSAVLRVLKQDYKCDMPKHAQTYQHLNRLLNVSWWDSHPMSVVTDRGDEQSSAAPRSEAP